MLAEERQRVILRVLEEKRAATVAVLCQGNRCIRGDHPAGFERAGPSGQTE